MDVQGSEAQGWSGSVTARDVQGSAEILSTPATLNLSGAWDQPRLSGTLGLFGGARH
ncbi:hypothetical protein [Deinococcus radiophilus]|uniref:hypothetical protein n=1 Tax=Deinococcus radiophilus TaxID=32062 RepID=UPI0036243208